MLQLNEYLLVAALVFVVLSLITYLVVLSASRRGVRRPVAARQLVRVGAGEVRVGAGDDDADVDSGVGDGDVRGDVGANLDASMVVGDAPVGKAGPVGTTGPVSHGDSPPDSKTVSPGGVGAGDIDAGVDASVVDGSVKDWGVVDWGVDADDDAADAVQAITVRSVPAAKHPQASVNVASLATGFSVIALLLLTVYLGVRIALTGHGPFSNQHEFAVSFVWGIMVAFVVTLWRFKIRMLALGVLPVAACLLGYATQTDAGVEPLVPALQNNLLLTLHVGFAILSYGAACVSFGAAVIYLIHPRTRIKTPRDRFDEIGYKGAIVAFSLMTIMILLGSLWANIAWGRYWGWDPKETAALVTWLLYGAFLHARVVRGWRGQKAAWLLIIGFAAVLFAYFGNYFFGGLHSYG